MKDIISIPAGKIFRMCESVPYSESPPTVTVGGLSHFILLTTG